MAETFVLSFIDKLILLEQKAGSNVHYRLTPPLSGPFDDCIPIQRIAKQIADSIGLTHFTFIAELNKHLEYIKQSFCETVDAFLVRAHGAGQKLCQKAETIAGASDHDPALRFLRSIRKNHELEQLAREIAAVGSRTQDLLWDLKVIARHLWQNNSRFPQPSATMFNIVKCPQDGTKLRLPQNSADLIVSCPTCRYRFAYNTKSITFSADASQPKERGLAWSDRLWKFLRAFDGRLSPQERSC
jgi:hypothetical protein